MWKSIWNINYSSLLRQNSIGVIKNFIVLVHQLGVGKSLRIDFESNIDEAELFKLIQLDEYKLYQFIDHNFLYNMGLDELDLEGIKYDKLFRTKKGWFGLTQKTVSDILIHPNKKFLYPYQYGNYFYYFTKRKIEAKQFEHWINVNFPNRFGDFDELLGYGYNDISLLNPEDYLVITNHDYQQEIGVSALPKITDKLIEQLGKTFTLKVEPLILNS
jgi:hypothetical protein